MTDVVLSLFRGEIVKPASVTKKSIAQAVADRHGLTLSELFSVSRLRRYAHARQEAMWMMRQVKWADGTPRYSYLMIAEFFGRDHTTIIHGVNAYEARLAEAQVAA